MITPRQVALNSGTAVALTTLAWACQVVLTNAGTGVAYVGAGTSVSVSIGHPIPVGQSITLANYPGSTVTTLYAISSGSATMGVSVSTAG